MKILLLTITLSLSILQNCFAVSSIQINNVNKKDVIDYVVSFVATSGINTMLEQVNEYGVIFSSITPIKNALGVQVGSQQNKINFTAIQQNNNVMLTVNEMANKFFNNGTVKPQQINSLPIEKFLLDNIKMYFNDYYSFGYTPTDTKQNGGFIINNVIQNFPMYEAGIKDGDIIISVNKIEVIKNKDIWLHCMHDRFNPQKTIFTIKRNGKTKNYIVTPKLCKNIKESKSDG